MAIRHGRGVAALVVLLTTAAFSAQTPPAPDVSGTWTGKFISVKEGTKAEEPGYAVLKQTGTAITGSVGPSAERQQEITTGKIDSTKDGTTVRFDSGHPGHVLHFELKLIDGRLTGTVKDEFYPDNKITVELQRLK